MATTESLVAPATVLVEGPLRKSTAKGNTFQKRWVWLLEGGRMQYTKDVRKHDSPSAKRTTINLTDAQLVVVSDSGGKFVFRLCWDATREYSFAADDASDFLRWHSAIAAAIPTTVTLTFVRNERFDEATGSWSSAALLPSDPPPCCDERGAVKSLEAEPCPDEHWQWTGQWEIDRTEWADVGVDEDGWQYALDWPSTDLLTKIGRGRPVPKWTASSYRFAYVRRRRHTRSRTRDEPHQAVRLEDSLCMANDSQLSPAGGTGDLGGRGSLDDDEVEKDDLLLMKLAQGELVREGWLWKRGQYNTNHKRRWFILNSTGLLFYKKEPSLGPIGCIDLCDSFVFIAEDAKSKEDYGIGVLGSAFGAALGKAAKKAEDTLQKYKLFAFKIVPRGQKEREFALCAEAQEEMDEWTESINATIPAVATVEIWQNERWDRATQRWGPARLIEAERPEWSDEGGASKAIDDEVLPDAETWTWLGPWKVDISHRCDRTEGWQYAINWPNPLLPGVEWDAVCSVTSLVRRRRWARSRQRSTPEQIKKTFTAVMHHSASLSGLRLSAAQDGSLDPNTATNPLEPMATQGRGSVSIASMYVIQTTVDGTVMIKAADASAARAILEAAADDPGSTQPGDAAAAAAGAAGATAKAPEAGAETDELTDGLLLQEGSPPAAAQPRPAAVEGLKSSYEISKFEEVTVGKFIAQGTTGSVHRGRWEGMDCAVKLFDYKRGQKQVVDAFRTEAIFLRNLNHHNLVRMYAMCSTPPNLCILTELMTSSLDNLLYGKGRKNELTERRQVRIAIGVANGMAFLHRNSVCHRDLKSPNVLYDRDLNIKLCDFAFSKFKDGISAQMESRVGTPAWMAPEVLCGEPYSLKADVYSFGVILWEIVHRARPFQDLNAWAIAYQVGMQGRRLPIPFANPEVRGEVPPIVAYMITQCWRPEAERPTFETIIEQLLTPMKAVVENAEAAAAAGGGGGLASLPVPSAAGMSAAASEPEPEPESTPEPEPEPEPERPAGTSAGALEEGVPAASPQPQPQPQPQLRAPPALDGDGFANAANHRRPVTLRAPPPLEPSTPAAAATGAGGDGEAQQQGQAIAPPAPSQPIHYAVEEVHYIAETVDEFIELLTEAAVDEETLVWQEGMADWEALGECTSVRQALGLLSDSAGSGSANSGDLAQQQTQAAPAPATAVAAVTVAGADNYEF
jgi:serine/threonine protein kinase